MATVPSSPPVSTLLTEAAVKTLVTTSTVAVTDLPATVNPNIAQGQSSISSLSFRQMIIYHPQYVCTQQRTHTHTHNHKKHTRMQADDKMQVYTY